MAEQPDTETRFITAHLRLRKIFGFMAVTLPIGLFLGALIRFDIGLQGSISAYYHTGMRDVFVGALCGFGLFLFAYKGYKPLDDKIGTLGGAAAIGVALFPTADGSTSTTAVNIGYVHAASMAVFFLALIYFSLFLFTKTKVSNPPQSRTAGKVKRDRVYKVTGYTMLICLVLIGIKSILPDDVISSIEPRRPVFVLESIAIMAFGFAWLTKGRALRDGLTLWRRMRNKQPSSTSTSPGTPPA